MTRHKNVIGVVIILIFSLALFLRVYKLEEVPPGMTIDEISIAYNALSISEIGKDQDGNSYPLTHFKSVDDYKLPLYIYVVAFFQKIFPSSMFAVRFPGALFASLAIVSTFFLGKQLFNTRVGIIASLLLAISQWHVFHSHLGLETNISLFFIISFFLFFHMSLKNAMFLPVSAVAFVLALYSHHSSWIFLPAMFFATITIYRKNIVTVNKKIVFLSLSIIIFLIVPFVLENNNSAKTRFNQSIFSPERIEKISLEAQNNCYYLRSFCISTYIIVQTAGRFINQYISSYSLIAWYGPSGFGNVDVMPNRGLFYFFEFPLFLAGIFFLVRKKNKEALFVFSWLFIFPLPIAITTNLSAARMYHFLPLPQIIEAIGFIFILNKSRIMGAGYICIIVFSFVRFLPDFWFVYPHLYSRFTSYGPIAIVKYINTNKENTFYVEEPLFDRLYLLYFYKALPKERNQYKKDEKGVLIDKHSNIFLVERGYIPPMDSGIRFISFPEDIPKGYIKVGVISLKDSSDYAVISAYKENIKK